MVAGAAREPPLQAKLLMALTFAKRKTLRLEDFDYSQPGAYFVTIGVSQRKCLLGTITDGEMKLSKYGSIVAESWQWLATAFSYILLDEWSIMPNHFHGIIFINQPQEGGSRTAPTLPKSLPLSRLVGAFKTVSSKRINIHRKTPGIPFWQRGFYEHVIRHEEALNRIRDYIATNPWRWELDRENSQATGKDDFEVWLAKFQPKPRKTEMEL